MKNQSHALHSKTIESKGDDAIEHPPTDVYFLARECEIFYLSITRRHESREARARVLPVLENAVQLLQQTVYVERIDDLLAELFATDLQKARSMAVGVGEESRKNARVQELKDKYEQECKFYEVEDAFDDVWLKKQTKLLKKRHHPDRGGTHELMLKINTIEAKFRDFLMEFEVKNQNLQIDENVAIPERPESARAFLARLRVLLLNIYIDSWDFDKGIDIWRILDKKGWDIVWKDTQNASRLALKLAAAPTKSGNDEVAREVFAIFRRNMPPKLRVESNFTKTFSAAASATLKSKKVSARITHPIQAENACRHGLIKTTQYVALLKKFEDEHQKEQTLIRNLHSFKEKIGFLSSLPTDGEEKSVRIFSNFVPYPRYLGLSKYNELQELQQIEYHRAFRTGRLELIRKYTSVRLLSLLESGVLCDNGPPLDAISRECRFLDHLQRKGTKEDGALVATVLEWLAFLTPTVRERKLHLIRTLNIQLNNNPESFSFLQHLKYKVGVNEQFFQTIKLPNTELQRILNREPESTSTTNVRREKARRLQEESVLVDNLKENHGGYAQLFASLNQASVNPEGVVRCLEPYIQDLLKLGQQLEHVELLNIAYWLNPLTVALVRLKQYKQANDWLYSYFSLPPRYWRKSDSSLNNQLRKRHEKVLTIIKDNS